MKPLHLMLSDWQASWHLSSSEAARRCGVSPQHWHQLITGETDNPRAGTLLKLAHGTGFSMESLAEASEVQRAVTV